MDLKKLALQTFGKIGAKTTKHMPDILLGIGLLAGAATVYSAAKETLNVEDILDESKKEIDNVKSASEEPDKAELTKVYIKTGAKLLKNYYPTIIFGTTSVACILASNGQLKSRTAQTIAAYNTLDTIFKNYRENVVEQYGEEVDKRLRFGLKEEKVDVIEYDEEGNQKESKKKVTTYPHEFLDTSEFARLFGPYSDNGLPNLNWNSYQGNNALFLRNTERYFNDVLNTRGHVFLNEIYDALGYKRTKSGQVVGWVKGEGDGCIKFGIDDIYTAIADGVLKYQQAILLEFNVQGVIIDKV